MGHDGADDAWCTSAANQNPRSRPMGWPPFFSPCQIDDGVAVLLLHRPDLPWEGHPSSPLARSTVSQLPFFSSGQIHDMAAKSMKRWQRDLDWYCSIYTLFCKSVLRLLLQRATGDGSSCFNKPVPQ
ncbi:uncharacterized protein LOC110434454 isoform X2 [Sorghum bicolor]|uniref:uncharacterized protein LOC110434454 isoform X2 n=1 Tax=Sorghum bicolor TaxID=4558 RepID=UPI000B42465C|nr:uncharacterized protein LOC110434454 isoform X2 [Sorghum bicolor]|eukprot:XP_021314204.1 uncharacterized protein LOC110434454 isoform X2 [Sorghum bicolor]